MQDTGIALQSDIAFSAEGGCRSGGAVLIRLSRYAAVFVLVADAGALRVSEVLADFTIGPESARLYRGRAVVRGLVHDGPRVVCEVTLNDEGWLRGEVAGMCRAEGGWTAAYRGFLDEWQKHYRIVPEYKHIVADMQTYLADLRFWLARAELGLAPLPDAERAAREMELAGHLSDIIIPTLNELFDHFESVARQLVPAVSAVHQNYMRRQLHALALEAPFAHRTFTKPLGYAGDYEMVNMILRNAPEGRSVFGRVFHTWFVRQKPAEAHRNRTDYLVAKITDAALAATARGRNARVFNMACGPADEVQRFLAQSPLHARVEFTLLDFNEETLDYTRARIAAAGEGRRPLPEVAYVKKSVHHLLKEGVRRGGGAYRGAFDLVYCAGLFDYLSDDVCHLLLNVMYDWVAPGGLLVATNVEPRNPRRLGMDHLLDWPLIYRTAADFGRIRPTAAPGGEVRVFADTTGVNVFLEAAKPEHG